MQPTMALLYFDELEEKEPSGGNSFFHRDLELACEKLRLVAEWSGSPDEKWYYSVGAGRDLHEALEGTCPARLDTPVSGDLQGIWTHHRDEPIYQELAALRDEWKRTRPKTSGSVLKAVMHPSYQRIIGKGAAAVPFILHELEQEPDHWFWALMAITGEDPVTAEVRGDIRQMASAWIAWGRREGYL